MDFNELFGEVGGYGRYQKLMLWFVLLPSQLPYLCQMYCHLFMSITPDHWCKVSLLDAYNVTDHFNRHLFVPKKDNVLHSLQYEQCFVYNISYNTLVEHSIQIGWIPNQTWPIAKCSTSWVYNRTFLGHDDSIITKWDLVCDRAYIQIIPIIIFFAGSFVGVMFGNLLSNKFGLKSTYFVMLCLQCLFSSGIALSARFDMFCIMRFGVGFCIPNIASIPKNLSLELTSQLKGPKVLLLCELWRNIGALLLVLVSYLIRDFNHLTVAISVPFMVFLLYLWLYPESPKWLIMNERIEEVDKMVRDIAKTNVTLLSPDFCIALRRRIRVECALQTELKTQQKHWPLIQLLSQPKMPLKVITICLLYITHSITDIGFTYYIIEFSDDRGNGDIYYPFLVVIIANYLGLLIARITLNRFGRKYSLTFGDILSAFFSLMSAFVKNKDINLCVIYFASAKVFQSSSQYCLLIWCYELLPISYYYSVITLCEIVSQLALISVPIIIFYSKKREIWIMSGISLSLCLSIFGCLLLISALLGFILPDTNHHKVSNSWQQNNISLSNHSQWKDESQYQNHKKTHKPNGILKNNGPQQQSPILRKQELMRQKDYELESIDRITELNDSPNKICTITRVTVL